MELSRVQQKYPRWNKGCNLHWKRIGSVDGKGGVIHRLGWMWLDQDVPGFFVEFHLQFL